jgi:hypothetical protein
MSTQNARFGHLLDKIANESIPVCNNLVEAKDVKAFLLTMALGSGLSLAAMAQTPVTATCKDGTSFSGTSRSGACSGHGGVQTWGAAAATPPAATTTTTSVTPKPTAPPPASTAAAPAAAPSPGGGPGQVWVNTASKVYHCPGTEWYGKTKKGGYMTEAAAKAAGNHADHGKACSS